MSYKNGIADYRKKLNRVLNSNGGDYTDSKAIELIKKIENFKKI